MTEQYADVSSFQGNIDWSAYKAWSNMVAMKATEGVGFTDPDFHSYRSGALSVGMNCIIYYHYARPDLNPGTDGATRESAWFLSTIGTIRPQDLVMLDYEQGTPNATAQWADDWLFHTAAGTGKPPLIYASPSYIQAHLQDSRLAAYPLVLADWQFTPDERPAAPWPWSSYQCIQFTDRGSVPGIAGNVDVNVFLGGISLPITGGTNDMMNITDPFAATFFKQTGSNPDRWTCTNGQDLFAGILDGWRKMNGAPRLPLGPEMYTGKQVVYKECESGILVYDPGHELDGPRGPWEPCYLLKFDSDLAKQLLSSGQSAPVDTTAVVAAINGIADGIAPLVANALIEAKKL